MIEDRAIVRKCEAEKNKSEAWQEIIFVLVQDFDAGQETGGSLPGFPQVEVMTLNTVPVAWTETLRQRIRSNSNTKETLYQMREGPFAIR